MKSLLLAAVLLLGLGASASVRACDLPPPKEDVILTVSGAIGGCTRDGVAEFDLKALEALPVTEVKTANPWEKGEVSYQGVRLSVLADTVKASGETAVFSALNDYSSDIPVSDLKKYTIILAYKREGEYMSVRDKGPLWVIFPFTDSPELSTETRYAQSVWQVARLTIK